MNFRVGQKLVVVRDDAPPLTRALPPFRNGDVVTVSGVAPNGAVELSEYGHDEATGIRFWSDNRFRPAVERKTDISVFTAMLTPKKSKERVYL